MKFTSRELDYLGDSEEFYDQLLVNMKSTESNEVDLHNHKISEPLKSSETDSIAINEEENLSLSIWEDTERINSNYTKPATLRSMKHLNHMHFVMI